MVRHAGADVTCILNLPHACTRQNNLYSYKPIVIGGYVASFQHVLSGYRAQDPTGPKNPNLLKSTDVQFTNKRTSPVRS